MGAVIGGLGPDPQGGIDWPIGLVFGAVRIPTAFLGSLPVSQLTILLAFAGLTLITAVPMLLHACDPTSDRTRRSGRTPGPRPRRERRRRAPRRPAGRAL